MASSPPIRVMPRYLKATYLADQEYLLEETRATKLFYFPAPVAWTVLWGILTILTLGPTLHTTVVTLPTNSFLTTSVWRYLGYFFGLLTIAGLLWLFVRYLRWVSTVYAVTSRRVILQRGIFGRGFDEIPVGQVRGVDVHQSVGQRILGYGTVHVTSEGGSRFGNEDWRGIPSPFKFQRLIENATQAATAPAPPAPAYAPPNPVLPGSPPR